MIQISILGKRDQLTLPIEKFATSHSTNSAYLYFNTDAAARDNELMLKEHGFKTEHTDKTIRIREFSDCDVIIPE